MVLSGDGTSPGTVFVAGNITSASGIPVRNVASFFNGQWAALGQGIEANDNFSSMFRVPEVELGYWNGSLICGGAIERAGNISVNNIALWNGVEWIALSNNSYFQHYRMSPFVVSQEGSLFLAAQGLEDSFFEDVVVNGYPLVENLLAEYFIIDALWTNFVHNELLVDGIVLSMAFYNESSLIIGGGFRKVGDFVNLNNVLMLVSSNGQVDSYSSFSGGVFGLVTSLEVLGLDIYLGGVFQYAEDRKSVV